MNAMAPTTWPQGREIITIPGPEVIAAHHHHELRIHIHAPKALGIDFVEAAGVVVRHLAELVLARDDPPHLRKLKFREEGYDRKLPW